jgi:hypothetical protein
MMFRPGLIISRSFSSVRPTIAPASRMTLISSSDFNFTAI